MPRKTSKSSWYKLGMIYGGTAAALVNPVLGVAVAGIFYKLHKDQKILDDAERELRAMEQRKEFKNRFYRRQNFVSYSDYLASPRWREKRALVIRRAKGHCEYVGCENSIEEVHHKYYPRIWGEENLDSLIGLCAAHHREAHGHPPA